MRKPIEFYVARVVRGMTALICAYFAVTQVSLLFAALAFFIGRGALADEDFGNAWIWGLYCFLYLISIGWLLSLSRSEPRRTDDWLLVAAAGGMAALWVNLWVGLFRRTWAFLR